MNILNLEHISIAFLSRVLLDDVTVGISDSDKIGVIGVNGTGKSTLLSIAAGRLLPDQGRVVKGNSVRIAYLPQNPVFDNRKTLLENVAEAVNGKASHWDTAGEVRARLQDFGIPDPECNPDILSGGQKKRAALVAAILTPCDLLILDEPTNHLDHEMIEWLQGYLQNFRGAVLMVTHDRYFLDQVTNQ
ncbi:MAG: ATP-binding cassette domain-containing protein, partial [Lachnospiraceae bacterium]|nr:ATP-binding cassette domain-containing protein [Lachnospiraceae bacterium]